VRMVYTLLDRRTREPEETFTAAEPEEPFAMSLILSGCKSGEGMPGQQ